MKKILLWCVSVLSAVLFLASGTAAQELDFEDMKARTDKVFKKSNLIFMGATQSVFLPLPQEVKMIAGVAFKTLETPSGQPADESDENMTGEKQGKAARIIGQIISNFF